MIESVMEFGETQAGEIMTPRTDIFALPVDTVRILFTADEDPVFGQLNVTLLRAVRSDCRDEAYETIIQTLYDDLTGGESHG